jgi:hypothetical protein
MSSWKAIPVLLTLSFAHFVGCVLGDNDVCVEVFREGRDSSRAKLCSVDS